MEKNKREIELDPHRDYVAVDGGWGEGSLEHVDDVNRRKDLADAEVLYDIVHDVVPLYGGGGCKFWQVKEESKEEYVRVARIFREYVVRDPDVKNPLYVLDPAVKNPLYVLDPAVEDARAFYALCCEVFGVYGVVWEEESVELRAKYEVVVSVFKVIIEGEEISLEELVWRVMKLCEVVFGFVEDEDDGEWLRLVEAFLEYLDRKEVAA